MTPTRKQEIEGLMLQCKQWDKAIENNDTQEIEKFMSNEWVIVGTEGGITKRSGFLNSIKSGVLVHNRMDFEDLKVEVYDNTGIVVGKGTSAGTYQGRPFSFYEWSTSVFIKNDGSWLCVLTMLTPAQKKKTLE
jgi:ketosteroid isomerase-like protein